MADRTPSTTYRVSNLDVARAGSWTLSAYGPVEFGGREGLIAALETLSRSGPQGRVGLVADPATTKWRFDPQRLLRSVTEIDPVSDEDLSATMTRLIAERDTSLPIWVTIAGDRLFVFLEHGLGDGRLTLDLSLALTDATRTGVIPAWQQRPPARARALPQALLGAIQANPRLPLETTKKSPVEQSQPATVPWTPAPTAAYARGTADTLAELAAWKKSNNLKTSTAALLMAAKVRALREVGLDPYRTVHILFDGRRYLPQEAHVLSNFAAGLEVPLDNPGDPLQLAAAMRSVAAQGRPAANLAVTAAKVAMSRRLTRSQNAHAGQLHAPASPRPKMAFTDMGSAPQLEAIGWTTTDPTQRQYCAMVDSPTPEAVTFTSGRLTGGATDTACFHHNVFSADLIQKAMTNAVSDPVRLLSAKDL